VRACAFFSVRGAASMVTASSVGVELHHGADWAYSLHVEEPGRSLVASDQALVVIREPDARNVDLWAMRQQCLALLEGLDRLGYGTTLLPFSPGDERFSETLALNRPILSHWTNPRLVKGLLADAALCVSVGRLHPLILAHSAGTPTIYVSLDAAIGGFVGAKIRDLCRELAIPFLPVNVDAALSSDALASAIGMARATAGPAADVLARWSDMRGRVIAALAGDRQAAEVGPSPSARSVARL
jgi:polysaccharide pyruvyl transferase WcaK-like protein